MIMGGTFQSIMVGGVVAVLYRVFTHLNVALFDSSYICVKGCVMHASRGAKHVSGMCESAL
jgi:hypothetical protein